MLHLPYFGNLQNSEVSETPGKLFMALEAAMASSKAGLHECLLCVLTKTPSPVGAEQPGQVFGTTEPRLYP